MAAVVSSGHAVRDMPELVAGEEEWTVGRASSAVTREVCGGGVSEIGWRRGGTAVMQYLRREALAVEALYRADCRTQHCPAGLLSVWEAAAVR